MGDVNTHLLIDLLINLHKLYLHSFKVEKNEALSIIYYKLIADYCILFESALKKYLKNKGITPRDTLGKIIEHNLDGSTIYNISSNRTTIITGNRYSVHNLTDYNLKLAGIIYELNSCSNRLETIAILLHIICITRNQVAHDINVESEIFGKIHICRRLIRLITLGLFFEEYI